MAGDDTGVNGDKSHVRHGPPVSATTASGREVLAGLVERVTFHNPETGFCVLRVKARGHRDLVTAVGHAAMISAGTVNLTSPGQNEAVDPRIRLPSPGPTR